MCRKERPPVSFCGAAEMDKSAAGAGFSDFFTCCEEGGAIDLHIHLLVQYHPASVSP